MKLRLSRLVFIVLFAVATLGASSDGATSHAQRRRRSQPPRICFNPSMPCPTAATFEPHDLPFEISPNSVIVETPFFYAVILKSIRAEDTDCERFIAESERLQAQSLFPRHKVFTSRCADPGSLYYTNVHPAQRFMAVYGGATRAEAARMLALVKATGKFPGANIRRMRAGFNGT
jgi:hypothetical protein